MSDQIIPFYFFIFKSWRNKNTLIFIIRVCNGKLCHFVISKSYKYKMTEMSYLPLVMPNPNDKGTLFSLTLKVEIRG